MLCRDYVQLYRKMKMEIGFDWPARQLMQAPADEPVSGYFPLHA